MKKHLKAALAAMLALVMALAAIPVSALPRFEAETAKAENAAIEPYWTVPDGYNAHDYNKCVQFLEQTDENGVKIGWHIGTGHWENGEYIYDYDPSNPETWGSTALGEHHFQWTSINGEKRLQEIHLSVELSPLPVYGILDVTECTALESVDITDSRLSGLFVTGCTALRTIGCSYTNISELNVSGCTALEELWCASCSLTKLFVYGCTALRWLECGDNMLTELDVTQNTALKVLRFVNNDVSNIDVTHNDSLEWLACSNNNLTELDVTQNAALRVLGCDFNNLIVINLGNNLPYDAVTAVGDGCVGYSYTYSGQSCNMRAYPRNNAVFEGFYDESGALVSEGEWSYYYEAYTFGFAGEPSHYTGTIIARFSGGSSEPTPSPLPSITPTPEPTVTPSVEPSLPDDVPSEQISDWFPYHSSVTEKNERYTFDYDDSWFFTESDVYQHDLTKMSIRLAMSAKKETDVNFKILCGRMNYKDIECHYETPTEDTIGYAIARKNIVLNGKAISVIVVGVRGGGYGLEWANNGRVGTGIEHEGFSNAAQNVYEGISAYIDSHRSELHSDIKVWIAGFSRAAAVSNITAKKLIDNPVAGMSETDVYAFCFESPYSTRAANASDEKYRGIRSFINRIDFVPYVPLAGWGYKRYGRTYYTPNKMKSLNYDQKKQNMKEEYRNILQAMIENFSPGEINSLLSSHTLEGKEQAQIYQKFCDVLAAKIPDVNDYLIHYQSYVMTILGNTLGGGSNDWGLEVANLLCNLIMSGSSHLGVELGFVTTAYLHFNKCHFAELCLAWIDSIESEWDMMELNYTNATVTSATSGTKDDAALNISVYDSANTLVAQVINGEVVDDETGICAYIDSNDQLCLDFPAGEDYRIEVSSAADTELAITMTKYVGESNTPEKLVSYFDVALSAGDTCTGIVENINENDEPYSLLVNGEEIEPSADLGEDDQIEHLVDVEVEGGGRVYFPGTFVTGEYAKLRVAFNEENFLGWYLDGELLSTAPEYRIMVTEDMLITAKFSTKLGDVNLDGKLSIADTILIARYVLGLIELEAPCDLDGNRLISIADAIVSARYTLGLMEP